MSEKGFTEIFDRENEVLTLKVGNDALPISSFCDRVPHYNERYDIYGTRIDLYPAMKNTVVLRQWPQGNSMHVRKLWLCATSRDTQPL